MNESDITFGVCPKCGDKTFMTGRWAKENPTLSDGTKACIECKVADIYAEFFNRH